MSLIDLEALFRTRIDSALTTAAWAEKVMHLLRLEGVSQVWSPRPAWYFWLHGAVGPYHLQLESATTRIFSPESRSQTGLFSLRCYPYQSSAAFALISEEEQCLVKSDFFDETNTPQLEHLGDIPVNLFQIGAIEHTVGCDESWELIAMEGLGKPRSLMAEQAAKPCDHFFQSTPKFGDADGPVTVEDICDPFFDIYISLLSYRTKHKLVRMAIQATEEPEEPEEAPDGLSTCRCDHADGFSSITKFVILGDDRHEAYPEADALLDNELKREDSLILCDERFRCGCWPHSHRQSDRLFPVNELWWTLAEKVFPSSVTSTCGCK